MKLSTIIIIVSIIMMIFGIGGYYYQTGQMDTFLARNFPEVKQFLDEHLKDNNVQPETRPLTLREEYEKEAKERLSPKPLFPEQEQEQKQEQVNKYEVLPETKQEKSNIIYSWTDEKGIKHFTSSPPPDGAGNVKKISGNNEK